MRMPPGGFAHGQLQRLNDGQGDRGHSHAGPGAGDDDDGQDSGQGNAEYDAGIGTAGQDDAVVGDALEDGGVLQDVHQKQGGQDVPGNIIGPCGEHRARGGNAGHDVQQHHEDACNGVVHLVEAEHGDAHQGNGKECSDVAGKRLRGGDQQDDDGQRQRHDPADQDLRLTVLVM